MSDTAHQKMVARSPYFCFIRGGWVPAVIERDSDTGIVQRGEGPNAFATWREADEASRFLRLMIAGGNGAAARVGLDNFRSAATFRKQTGLGRGDGYAHRLGAARRGGGIRRRWNWHIVISNLPLIGQRGTVG